MDAIALPVTTGTAYDFGTNADPVSAYLSDLYTVPASLAGLPGVAIPCGIHSNGRPIGLQLLANTLRKLVFCSWLLNGSVQPIGICVIRPTAKRSTS